MRTSKRNPGSQAIPKLYHNVGRIANSDWFVNNFTMDVDEKIFNRSLDTKFSLTLKMFLWRTIINFFTKQAELIDLPTRVFIQLYSCTKSEFT